ncbi:hypothetical protein CFB40_12870 [Burkholderia sp. AU31652]|nr:hypothetical protein CFB43_13090 [Burkholderia sp. AU15512]OXI86600.1 hypothetical protein CFB40_12870 [Burkholderia sp. AU31652]OXJ12215.1 hypothetical protein CFB45_13345 [Burkholderia sp. HI2500]
MQTTPAWGTERKGGVGRRGVPCGSATGHVALQPDNRVDHIGQRWVVQCNISPIFHQSFAI